VKLTARPIPPRPVIQRTTDQSEGAETSRTGEPAQVEFDAPAVADRGVNTVFRIWLLAFALVGMQMSWVLRPFIGSPERAFAWYRPREASFFEAIASSIRTLLVGS
jgi:hypothetical protein